MEEKNKKDFPISVHQNLNQLRSEFPRNFKSASPNSPLMVFKDTDENSKFYFQVTSYEKSNNDFYYKIAYRPINADNLDAQALSLKFEDLHRRLKTWKSVIELYDQTQHFFYDPIVESYTKEYFDEYQILEDDADINPFDIKRQLLIDNYLENSVKFLQKFQKKDNEINLDEPIQLAISLRNSLTTLTKNEVIKKLSQFWAVSRKKGLPIIKEIFFELAKELIKEWGKKMLGL